MSSGAGGSDDVVCPCADQTGGSLQIVLHQLLKCIVCPDEGKHADARCKSKLHVMKSLKETFHDKISRHLTDRFSHVALLKNNCFFYLMCMTLHCAIFSP